MAKLSHFALQHKRKIMGERSLSPALSAGRVAKAYRPDRFGDAIAHGMKKRRYLTARMPDGYVKTIGPTSHDFSHYWRIVAELENGKSEVFWGHTKNLKEAQRKKAASEDAKKLRGWKSYLFEIADLEESIDPPETFKTGLNKRR